MSNDKDSSLDKIKEEFNFIADSVFYKIYEEFDISCDLNPYDNSASCPPDSLSDSTISEKVINLLKALYSNLYRVYFTSNDKTNDYFDNDYNRTEVKKIGCICLKYWLYDQIITRGLVESEIKELFNGYKNYINGKIKHIPKDYCNINELDLNYIKTIKKIYALNTFLHTYNKNSNNCNSNSCKYMEYFGEGLDEFIYGINNCTNNLSNKNYCNQLNEFINMCKNDNEYAGISIYYENTKSKAESEGKYLLSVETYENKLHYMYIKNKEVLNLLKNSHFLNSQNRTTIAATSVVGSAIGLSSIFYYFYKFTPFGSTLRKGKGKNIGNIDEEAHNSLLYTSDTEKTPFENRKYNVAYHTFSDN
ncbi:PIR protein [Plasmodium vivax]|nr:PIR protein [Plasmodium vivax]